MPLVYRVCVFAPLIAAATIFFAAQACSSDPQVVEVGALGQACYANNTCNNGLVCYAIVFDGGFSDGGQCLTLHDEDATDEQGDAADATDEPIHAPEAATDAQGNPSDALPMSD